jgi:hypothetical protein
MPAPSSPPPGSADSRASYANPNMRISDAERTEVADRLSLHYGDGRLDQEEFDRRLHQAMSAVTQADLNGLFADLPDADTKAGGGGGPPPPAPPPPPPPPGPEGRRRAQAPTAPPAGQLDRRPPRRLTRRAIALVLIILVAASVGHAMAHLVPWVLIAVLAVALLCARPRRRN